MSLSSTHTTPPQPPTTPENGDPDPENDSNDVPGTDVSHDIPPPPVDQFYDTLEDALQTIREFTKEHGYALTKLRSKIGKDGEVNKVYLQCDRGKFRTSRVQEQNRQI